MVFIWLVVAALIIAVVVLFVMFMQKSHSNGDDAKIEKLENKVQALESNLQKTLEIMQELAKKMNVQQEVLELNAQKLKQVESQNAELVKVVLKNIDLKNKI